MKLYHKNVGFEISFYYITYQFYIPDLLQKDTIICINNIGTYNKLIQNNISDDTYLASPLKSNLDIPFTLYNEI